MDDFSYEIGPIRPPSEGGRQSLLLRVTRNCPWSRCKFCYGTLYERAKFELRSVSEVKRDIDTVKSIRDDIQDISLHLGDGGKLTSRVAGTILHDNPGLGENPGFAVVFNWLYAGGRTVFLQDADSLTIHTSDLLEIVTYLKATFPGLERVTSYARAKTIFRKTPEELKALRTAGLTRLHVGLETGDDELLVLVEKGVTAQEHIVAGLKAKDAGFELSQYVMPDLGGRQRTEQHAVNTARVLSAISPDYIRFRPFIPRRGTPMYDDYKAGRQELSSAHQRLREVKTMIERLNVTSRVCFDHFANAWRKREGGYLFKQDYEGYQFPEEKPVVLGLIEEGLAIDESIHPNPEDLVSLAHL